MRRTLVDLLRRDIDRDDANGPDWPAVVEDAVLRQDMEWVIELGRCTSPPPCRPLPSQSSPP
jgi:hypothetical protein